MVMWSSQGRRKSLSSSSVQPCSSGAIAGSGGGVAGGALYSLAKPHTRPLSSSRSRSGWTTSRTRSCRAVYSRSPGHGSWPGPHQSSGLVAGQPECVVKWSDFDRSDRVTLRQLMGPAGECPLALVSLCLALGDGYGEAARALLDEAGCFPVLVQHL